MSPKEEYAKILSEVDNSRVNFEGKELDSIGKNLLVDTHTGDIYENNDGKISKKIAKKEDHGIYTVPSEKREQLDPFAKYLIIKKASDNYLPDEITKNLLKVLDKYNRYNVDIVPKYRVLEHSFKRIIHDRNFFGSTSKLHIYIKKTLEHLIGNKVIGSNNGDIVLPLKYDSYLKEYGSRSKK